MLEYRFPFGRQGLRRRLATGLLTLALIAAPSGAALARDPPGLTTGTVLAAAQGLKPGEFIWAPQIAPAGPILFVINIATQRGMLYRNGLPIAITTVSTGRPGHKTPTGVFTVLQKQVEHYSSIYDAAPMPYMERLTWGGIALHGGALPGYPASHGCIRLPKAFARLLYGETHLGMTVMIVQRDTLPALAPTADPLPAGASDDQPSSAYRWQPELAPTGPVSIVISAPDRTLLVLRNGREIGSAAIDLAAPVTRPWLFMVQSVDAAGPHWVQLPMPGETAVVPAPLRHEDVSMPEDFRRLLLGVIAPGTTVVVTGDTIRTRDRTIGALLESK